MRPLHYHKNCVTNRGFDVYWLSMNFHLRWNLECIEWLGDSIKCLTLTFFIVAVAPPPKPVIGDESHTQVRNENVGDKYHSFSTHTTIVLRPQSVTNECCTDSTNLNRIHKWMLKIGFRTSSGMQIGWIPFLSMYQSGLSVSRHKQKLVKNVVLKYYKHKTFFKIDNLKQRLFILLRWVRCGRQS